MEEDVVLSLFLGPSLVCCSFCDTQEGHGFGLRELLVEYSRYPNGHFTFIASHVNGCSLIVRNVSLRIFQMPWKSFGMGE